MTIETRLREARARLQAGEHMEAYRELDGALREWTHEAPHHPELPEALAILGNIIESESPESASLLAAAVKTPDHVDTLFAVAYALYEEGHFAAAAATLFEADRLAPSDPKIVVELAANLEPLMRYREAAQALDASGVSDREPIGAYLSGFNWLMTGALDEPRRRLEQLASSGDESIREVRETLAAKLRRADALIGAGLQLGESSLSAWQAVIDGTVLLVESPYGYEEGMRGRFAYLSDSPSLMCEGLTRLQMLIESEQPAFDRVVSAPDRASRILALAASELLGLPCTVWSADARVDHCLVVAWSMENVGDPEFFQALQSHAEHQWLFVHASNWTDPFPYSPDITTLLCQFVTHPYLGGATQIDAETREVLHDEPDPRDDAELAAEILGAQPDEDTGHEHGGHETAEQVLEIARALRSLRDSHSLGIHRTRGVRAKQWAGGPVPSNRFG